ncbi:TPA: glycosyltransferase [Candidatus Woesearchaeota archaeon]|nr:glycosyltransferase [Candidatus Woesearchaeota archaeon]
MIKPKITLCMIVKDENHPHLLECFESMKKHIDYWVICDTGSTDGTQEVIKEFWEKEGIPGELHEIPWEGFGKCRTKSLQLCDGKADYAWVIDADDMLVGDFKFPTDILLDAYSIRIQRGNFTWWRNQIFKTGMGWKYTGVLHEYAECPDKQETLRQGRINTEGYHIEARTLGGARNTGDPIDKYKADADTFLKCLTDENDPNYEPENARYVFYLAQSYFDSKQFDKAKEWYHKRAEMGGWEEEVFYSIFRSAICSSLVGDPWETTMPLFLSAWNFRPNRAEPLYHIARIYRLSGHPRLGYMFAKMAKDIPYPEQDILFIAKEVWDWQLDDEISANAFYVGQFEDGYNSTMKLLQENKFPESERQRIMTNLEQYQMKIMEVQEQVKKQAEHNAKIQEEIKTNKEARELVEKAARKKKVEEQTKQKAKAQKEKAKRKKKQKA